MGFRKRKYGSCEDRGSHHLDGRKATIWKFIEVFIIRASTGNELYHSRVSSNQKIYGMVYVLVYVVGYHVRNAEP